MDKTKEYHKRVWREAQGEAKNFIAADWRVLAGNIVLAVASGYATTRLLDKWGNAVTLHPVIQFLAVLLGAAFGFFALYVFHLGFSGLWFVPARLYRSQEILADKYTWNDIDISIRRYPPESNFGYGLQVTNKKPFDIHGFYGQVVWHKIKHYEQVTDPPHKLPLINGREFRWKDTKLDRDGGTKTLCLYRVLVDEVVNDDAWRTKRLRAEFAVPGSGQPADNKGAIGTFMEDDGVSLIEIEFGCMLDGRPLVPETHKKIYRAWAENGVSHVEEYRGDL